MDKKYQIFISSTFEDLIPERNKVRDVILQMHQFPIGMEMFSAEDKEQWKIIKETIDSSDYYVLIIGKRYGSVIEKGADKGISFTEKEYRYAKKIGLPILVYIKRDEAITADNVDNDTQKVRRLESFKNDVIKCREVKWFTNNDQLATEVTLSLHKAMDQNNRPGWIRNDSFDMERSYSENIELREQNRELQEKNRRLSEELERIKSSKRRPLLTVSLDYTRGGMDEEEIEIYKKDELISISEDGTVNLKLKKLSTKKRAERFNRIVRRNIPSELQTYISERDISDYNASLPSEDVIERYMKEYEAYLRCIENGVPITFFVNNLGTSKATDISATIEFPDQVRVFDCNEFLDKSEPEMPRMPKDIIEEALKKACGEKELVFNNPFPEIDNWINNNHLSEILSAPIFNSASFKSLDIEDNIVEIDVEQGIVHTKFDYFEGAYIVPINTGKYTAKVTLMCAEYEDPDVSFIIFNIEE